MNSEDTITIKKSVYDQLQKEAEWLSYLNAAGVDNWRGIEDAIQIAEENGYWDDETLD